MDRPSRQQLTELAWIFLRLGTIGFGGPTAHIALLEAEVVTRQQWLSRSQFLDLVGVTNLLPGPSSTELGIYIGYLRAGWRGLIIAGVCFILPATIIVWMLAIGYERVHKIPQAIAIFASIKPAIVVLTIQATWKLGRSALKNRTTVMTGIMAICLAGFGINTLGVILLAGIVVMLVQNWQRLGGLVPVVWLPSYDWQILTIVPAVSPAAPSAMAVLALFLKIGATIYGGGYVLLAFLQPELVDRTHWLTAQQLLDAVAIGQVTPGPLFTTATFIGYLLAGHLGAIAATVGIFVPSFIFVALATPWVPQLRRSIWFGSWLDGVNVGAWGAIAVVGYTLAVSTLGDWRSIAIAICCQIALWRKINAIWTILASALVGSIGQLAR